MIEIINWNKLDKVDWHQIHKDYENGETLRSLAKKYPISSKTIARRFEMFGWQQRAANDSKKIAGKRIRDNNPNWHNEQFIDWSGRIWVRDKDKTIRRSHFIWLKYHKSIPENHEIHHVDCDKTNDNIDNLQLLTATEHRKLHQKLKRSEPDDLSIVGIRQGEPKSSEEE